MTCPKCKIESTPSATHCDCGYPLVGGMSQRQVPVAQVFVKEGFPRTIGARSEVVIKDIDMPIESMFFFMIKWAVASIPALIVLMLVGALLAGVFGGILAGLFQALK